MKESGQSIDFAILNAGVASFEYKTIPSTGHKRSVHTNWLSMVERAVEVAD
jgi:hypothetical protein